MVEVAVAELGGNGSAVGSLEAFFAFGEASLSVMRARSALDDRGPGASPILAEVDAAHTRLRELFAAGDVGVFEQALTVIVLARRAVELWT